MKQRIKVFSGKSNVGLAKEICGHLSIEMGKMTKIGGKEDFYKIKLHKKSRFDRMLNSGLLHEIVDYIIDEG